MSCDRERIPGTASWTEPQDQLREGAVVQGRKVVWRCQGHSREAQDQGLYHPGMVLLIFFSFLRELARNFQESPLKTLLLITLILQTFDDHSNNYFETFREK